MTFKSRIERYIAFSIWLCALSGISACGGSGDITQTSATSTIDVQQTDPDTGFPLTDLCPLDSTKNSPGQCGCGVPDTDTDLDGTADCNDSNPANLFAADQRLPPGSASLNERSGPKILATSWDGRLAIGVKNQLVDGVLDSQLTARMFRPESATLDSNGVYSATDTFSAHKTFINRITKHTFHVSICSDPSYTENPYRSDATGMASDDGSYETYRIGIVTPGTIDAASFHLLGGYGHVIVANPRSPTASISSASMDGPLQSLRTISGDLLHRYEPSITPDCRLLVWHGLVDNHPQKSAGVAMYSYNRNGMATNGWSEPRSITDMYHVHGAGTADEPVIAGVRFSDRYPVAQQPMRNYDGTEIAQNEYMAGPYPWVSFDGSEIFFPVAITFEGPARSAVTAIGQRTGWTMRHLDGAINPSRSALMPDIENGTVVVFPANDNYPMLANAYKQLQRGDGQPLSDNGFQRLFMLPVGLTDSMWLNSVASGKNRFPINKRSGVYGFFLSHSGRYVEVDMHQAEDGNYVLYLPMNEQINYDRNTLSKVHAGQYSGVTKWRKRREGVEFMPHQTPDVSGQNHVATLHNSAAFPYEHLDAADTFQTAIEAFRADPTAVPGSEAVAGDSIHGIVGNAVFFPGGSFVTTALNDIAKQRLDAHSNATIELWVKPLTQGASYNLLSTGNVQLALEGGEVRLATEEFQLAGSTLPVNQWSHIAVTNGDDGAILYINAVRVQSQTQPFVLQSLNEVVIGPVDTGATNTALCLIDEVAISAVQRTPNEIRQSALVLSHVSDNAPQWQQPIADVFTDTPVYLPQGNGSPTDAQIKLGEALFSDTILSADRTLSCQSCHQPALAFTDGLKKAQGASVGARNTPPVFNRLFSQAQFVDGRAASLEAQALQPIINSAELNFTVEGVIERLRNSDYASQFEHAFNLRGNSLNESHLAAALAGYQRSLISAGSRHDTNDLTAQERMGRGLFYGQARCAGCHSGPNFSDEKFHAIGFDTSDPQHSGRAEITNRQSDLGKFRTPTLREIEKTAPYFHDGSKDTLTEVIEFYNKGGESDQSPKDFAIQPLGLSEVQKSALEAFLRALSGTTLPTE